MTWLRSEARPIHRAVTRRAAAAPWLLGLALALVLLGPMLGAGNLFNLDLVLVDPVPLPSGTWGLGPELPRRVPFMIPVAWLSATGGFWLATRGLFVLVIVLATVGAYRLASRLPIVIRFGIGLAYGASPFLVTRLGIGHFGIALAAAALPWTATTLLHPDRSLRATALAAGGLAFCGVTGGTYAGILVLAALVARRPPARVALRVVSTAAVMQLPWLVPGAVVLRQGIDPSSSALFGARIQGPLDIFRLAIGQGFWQDRFQIGFGRLDALLVGLVLVALAAFGARKMPEPWRVQGAIAAAAVATVVVASGVPRLDTSLAAAVAHPLLAPFRESQRLLPLTILWILLAAGHGTVRAASKLAERWKPLALAVPLATALVLVGPGAWGLGQGLDPYPLDPDWERARSLIEDRPGSVVALPWAQYLDVAEFDQRRVHHPAPYVLAADVIISSDPRLGTSARERADDREPIVDDLVREVRSGVPTADGFARLGVRWILILHSVDWQDYLGLEVDPGLEQQITGEVLDLYEVDGWQGPVITTDGATSVDWWVRPAGTVDAPDGGTWLSDGASGWFRGLSPVGSDGPAQLQLPPGRGLVWYWPAVLVLLADAAALLVVLVAALDRRRLRPIGFTHLTRLKC